MILFTYELTSIIKINARYPKVGDDIAALTRDYDCDDYVVIYGGIFDSKTITLYTDCHR